jgi:hypothetical protein
LPRGVGIVKLPEGRVAAEIAAAAALPPPALAGAAPKHPTNPRRDGGWAPVRIVMSRTLDLPEDARLWDTSEAPTIVATARGAAPEAQRRLAARGVEVRRPAPPPARPPASTLLWARRTLRLPARRPRGGICSPLARARRRALPSRRPDGPRPRRHRCSPPHLPQVVEFDPLTPGAVADYCQQLGFLQARRPGF